MTFCDTLIDMADAQRSTHPRGVRIIFIGAGLLSAAIGLSFWAVPPTTPVKQDSANRDDKGAADQALARLQEQYSHKRLRKQYDAIIDLAREQIERFGTHTPSHNFLAMVLSESGRLQEGYDRLRISLDLNRNQSKWQFTAGILATKLNRHERALDHYQRAISLDRENAIYRVHQAMVHIKMRQYDQARILLLGALRLDSNLPDAYFGLSELCFSQNQLIMALGYIDKAIGRTSINQRAKQAKYIHRKAWILGRANQWSDALTALRMLTARERREPDVIEEMAICWQNLGRPAQGAALYEQALALQPTAWVYAAGAARWYLRAGQFDAARRHLETLRQLNPHAKVLGELQTTMPSNELRRHTEPHPN